MYLTDKEKRMLSGEEGEAVRLAMELLTRIGEAYSAPRMVTIHSVHAGCVHPYFGAAVEMMEKFADLGGKFRALTTTNPVINPVNFNIWPEEPAELRKAAVRQINAIRRMGAIPTWSCVPYFQGNVPRLGEPASWEESSGVIFVNSVLGGRTNRTTMGMDVASSIAGRVPEFGLLLDENRKGNVLARLEYKPETLFDYGTIGLIIGKAFGGKLPVIAGLPAHTEANQLKALGAAMAIRGGQAMFHAIGVTPEARTKRDAFKGSRPEAEINITEQDFSSAVDEMNTIKGGEIDAVAIGCPHANIEEMAELASLLNARKIRPNITFCLFAASDVARLAQQMGYLDIIKAAGVKLLDGDCLVFHSVQSWGWKNIATNSAKYACLLPSAPTHANVHYADTKECVEMATYHV